MFILLVEDNELQGQLLKEMLSCDPTLRVVLVNSGESALSILEDIPFDLVVSDVILKGMDGYELAKRVKALNLKNPFFLYSSKLADEDDIELAVMCGADKYIEKTNVQGIHSEIINYIKHG